jgi:predicted small secreted protein|tara:strand:+ start:1504 stop:1668 length:165 start_codon:yes stop_codon:yes gene_type:complete
MIRKTIFISCLFALFFLNACNTVKGVATGAGRDVKTVTHYISCAWSWDKDCQKK